MILQRCVGFFSNDLEDLLLFFPYFAAISKIGCNFFCMNSNRHQFAYTYEDTGDTKMINVLRGSISIDVHRS